MAELFKQRENFLNMLYEYNCNEKNKICALNGDWGSGKTFLVEKIADKNKAENKFNLIHFDAWKNQGSRDINAIFLEGLYDELKSKYHKDKSFYEFMIENRKKTFQKICKIALEAIPMSKAVSSSIKVGQESIDDFINSRTFEIFNNEIINKFIEEKEFYQILIKMLFPMVGSKGSADKNTMEPETAITVDTLHHLEEERTVQNSEKHLIIIDELDRCEPRFAIEIIKKIIYMNREIEKIGKDVNFLICINKTEFAHQLKHYYGTKYNTEQYFDKIFDYEFELPDGLTKLEYFNLLLIDKKPIIEENLIYFSSEKIVELFRGLNYRKLKNLADCINQNDGFNEYNLQKRDNRLYFAMEILKQVEYEEYLNMKKIAIRWREDKRASFNTYTTDSHSMKSAGGIEINSATININNLITDSTFPA